MSLLKNSTISNCKAVEDFFNSLDTVRRSLISWQLKKRQKNFSQRSREQFIRNVCLRDIPPIFTEDDLNRAETTSIAQFARRLNQRHSGFEISSEGMYYAETEK